MPSKQSSRRFTSMAGWRRLVSSLSKRFSVKVMSRSYDEDHEANYKSELQERAQASPSAATALCDRRGNRPRPRQDIYRRSAHWDCVSQTGFRAFEEIGSPEGCQSHPRRDEFNQWQFCFGSKVKLHSKLNDSPALLLSCHAEDLVRLHAVHVKSRLQVRRPANERPQRVIQEVVGVEPELQSSSILSHLEILEQTQIGIEERRPVYRRSNRLARSGPDRSAVRDNDR